VSFTVTVNWHEAVFIDASVAVQVTVVVPTGNNEPENGTQPKADREQLSEAEAE